MIGLVSSKVVSRVQSIVHHFVDSSVHVDHESDIDGIPFPFQRDEGG